MLILSSECTEFPSLFSLESELSAYVVQGAECAHPVGGLLSVARGALSQGPGGVLLRLLLGPPQLSPAG